MKTNFLKATFLFVAVIFLSSCAKEALNETLAVKSVDAEMQAKGQQGAKSECEYNLAVLWPGPAAEAWEIVVREGVCGVDANSPKRYTFTLDDQLPIGGIPFDLDHDKDYLFQINITGTEWIDATLTPPSGPVINGIYFDGDSFTHKASCPGVQWIYDCPGHDKT